MTMEDLGMRVESILLRGDCRNAGINLWLLSGIELFRKF